MYNLKYYYMDKEILIATLLEDSSVVAYFDNGYWYFFEEGLEELKKKHKITKISLFDANVIMFGCFPNRAFLEKGYKIYEKPIICDEDTLNHFLENFKSFAKSDYDGLFHNHDKSLKYSAKELDIHYENAGYVDVLGKYYQEFLQRKAKGEFSYIEIVKVKKDYIITFNKSILNQ